MSDTNAPSSLSHSQLPEARQFDFLEGQWDAICRFRRLDGSWGEGPGTLTATKILDGCATMEFFEGVYEGRVIKAVGLRAFNPKTRQWDHTWTDSLEPGGFVVWRGRFEAGQIDLFGEWDDDAGQRIRSRLTWSQITDRSAHWESHRSLDRGQTWTKHWEVDFARKEAQ